MFSLSSVAAIAGRATKVADLYGQVALKLTHAAHAPTPEAAATALATARSHAAAASELLSQPRPFGLFGRSEWRELQHIGGVVNGAQGPSLLTTIQRSELPNLVRGEIAATTANVNLRDLARRAG
jgi:hypothetical protein